VGHLNTCCLQRTSVLCGGHCSAPHHQLQSQLRMRLRCAQTTHSHGDPATYVCQSQQRDIKRTMGCRPQMRNPRRRCHFKRASCCYFLLQPPGFCFWGGPLEVMRAQDHFRSSIIFRTKWMMLFGIKDEALCGKIAPSFHAPSRIPAFPLSQSPGQQTALLVAYENQVSGCYPGAQASCEACGACLAA